jgi:hypothetical protein
VSQRKLSPSTVFHASRECVETSGDVIKIYYVLRAFCQETLVDSEYSPTEIVHCKRRWLRFPDRDRLFRERTCEITSTGETAAAADLCEILTHSLFASVTECSRSRGSLTRCGCFLICFRFGSRRID